MVTSASLERGDKWTATQGGGGAPRQAAAGSRVSIPPGPFRVIVADDEHLVATGLAASIRELGHEVIAVVADGEAAVRVARESRPHLALLDIRMPRLDGIDAAAALATELGVPSIIVSAYSDEEHIQRIHARPELSGVFAYLLKPVNKDELRVAIGVAMQRAAVDSFRNHRIVQLEQNLHNRRVVEQAKWVLVEKHRMTEAQAHERLQRAARDRRVQLVEVAQGVIDSGSAP